MLKDGNSASVVEYCQRRLSKALNDAVKRQLIYRNPCQLVTPPKAQPKEMRLLELQEINHLLEVANGSEYYGIIHTALYTGLRRNELLALRWKDIDMNEAVIFLSRSLYMDKGGVTIYQPPKTAKGRRSVALTPSSAIFLKRLRQQQELDGLFHGYEVNEESLVFRYRTGSPMLPRAVSNVCKRIAEHAGLEGYRFHDNRHTHASLMLRQGVHPKVVQERLGHAKVATTMDVYSHVMPSLQQEAVQKFDLALETVELAPHLT
jgi:integrase